MRWKWRLGFLLILAIEIPVLLWAGLVMNEPTEILAYLAGGLGAVLFAILVVRPFLFGLAGAWLFGVAGGAWYFLRYVPPVLALALSATLSTLGCAVVSPVYRRILPFMFRSRIWGHR